jgi:hypothetical protein
MSGFRPTLASTPAGSGHNASHQPAVGISVPSKNPALSDMSLIYFILRPLSTSGHASFVVDGARDATQEGIAAACRRQSQRAPGIREQPETQSGQGSFRIFCSAVPRLPTTCWCKMQHFRKELGVKRTWPSDSPLTRHVDGQILDPRSLNWLRIEAH